MQTGSPPRVVSTPCNTSTRCDSRNALWNALTLCSTKFTSPVAGLLALSAYEGEHWQRWQRSSWSEGCSIPAVPPASLEIRKQLNGTPKQLPMPQPAASMSSAKVIQQIQQKTNPGRCTKAGRAAPTTHCCMHAKRTPLSPNIKLLTTHAL